MSYNRKPQAMTTFHIYVNMAEAFNLSKPYLFKIHKIKKTAGTLGTLHKVMAFALFKH